MSYYGCSLRTACLRILHQLLIKVASCDEMKGEKRNAYRVLVGKPEGRRPLGKSRNRRKNKINMDRITHRMRWPILDSVGSG